MNILVFGHIDSAGGAQNALRKLIDILKQNHTLTIVLPADTGSESLYYKSLGLSCYKLEIGMAIPNLSTSFLIYAHQNFSMISKEFFDKDFDLIISNTTAILHGAIIAHHLGKPHIFYAHECFSDLELQPTCTSGDYYIKLISDNTNGILSCSRYVEKQFLNIEHDKKMILSPFDFNSKELLNKYTDSSPIAVQIIGVQNLRKNTHFGVVLCKALQLMGIEVELHIIGNIGDGTGQLKIDIERRNFNKIFIHPHSTNPFQISEDKRVITLIAARTEPYGLTIVESLERGIPVIATKSGGPEDLLSEDYIFEFNDLDSCIRKLRNIINNYKNESHIARERFEQLKLEEDINLLIIKVNKFIENIKSSFSQEDDSRNINNKLLKFKTLLEGSFSLENLAKNISKASKFTPNSLTIENTLEKISLEIDNPGFAVFEDIKSFDAIPFAYSNAMDDLYKNGLGLAIELAANSQDIARLIMIFYIYSALLEKQEITDSNIRILALGDGLALDAIRLANCGLKVDYIDYDQSLMAKIAALNCKDKFGENQENVRFINSITENYDVIICLEVVELVPNPLDFITQITSYLKPDGLLFLSECFDGIEDRWPTHLYSNEKLSQKIPFLTDNNLELWKVNKSPFGKPYIFRKNQLQINSKSKAKLFEDNNIFKSLHQAISKLGC